MLFEVLQVVMKEHAEEGCCFIPSWAIARILGGPGTWTW